MRRAPIYLFLILTIGCTTTPPPIVVVEYKYFTSQPPSAHLTPCEQPFSAPPKTWGEAAKRDAVWLMHYKICAERIESLRRCYEKTGACVKPPSD